jgi:hypothetical protein
VRQPVQQRRAGDGGQAGPRRHGARRHQHRAQHGHAQRQRVLDPGQAQAEQAGPGAQRHRGHEHRRRPPAACAGQRRGRPQAHRDHGQQVIDAERMGQPFGEAVRAVPGVGRRQRGRAAEQGGHQGA